MSRKAFSIGVVALTVAWSIGLSALLAPLASSAATSGQLIKASLPAVYYMGSDGKRYVFPNEATYKTWYADFSSVVTITDAELASIAIGGNVTMRPGVKMVKITTDPKVYAIDAHGVLRWVTSEAVAIALYGANWNTMVLDIPDAFFTNYTVGSDITSAGSFNPASVTAAASSINADKNLAVGNAAGLSVSKASDSPAGATLPKGAMGVNFLKFNVTNGGSSAQTLSSLTVRRTGAGTASDFSNVYVYQGANRLTTGRTINSSSNEATFSGLNASIAAGATVSFWIAADISTGAGAGNVNMLEVSAVMVGGASVAGVPVMGSSFSISSASVGTGAAVASSGTLSAVKAGGMNQKVAEFQVTAPSSEDMDFHSIALFYSGTASRSKVTNLVLKQGGLTLATASSISDKDLAVFSLSAPMYMEKGSVRTFEVYADLAGDARSTENLAFSLDQTTDFKGIGRTYGYGVSATDSYAAVTVSIEAGKFTTTFNGPAAKDVARNGKDIELYNFTVAAASNLEIRQTDFVITTAAGDADCGDIDDLKVVDTATGAIIAGPVDLVSDDGDTTCDKTTAGDEDTIELTETWNINAGQTRTFKVTADIATGFTAGNTITVQFGDGSNLFDTDKVRNLDNSTYLGSSDFVPSTVIAGNAHTVKAAALTIGVSSTPVAQTYIMGTQGVSLGGITLKAGDASDIKVSSLAIQGEMDDSSPFATFVNGADTFTGVNTIATIVSTAKLWNGATQIGETESPTTSTATNTGGKITFDNLNLTVPAGQTITLMLSGNLAGGLSNLPDGIRFEVEAAGDVTATDKDGNSVTAGGTFPATGNIMTIQSAGSLSIALAPDDVESEAGLVVGGSSNAVLAKYKFTASNEELKLNKVRMKVATASGVTSLSLYDGATLVAGPVAVDGSGNADFASSSFVVGKDSSKTLTVKGNLNTVGVGGASSGAAVTVTLEGDDVSTFEVRGTGAGSSTLITDATAGIVDVAANTKLVRKTKPVISLVALPSTVISAGTLVFQRFTVSADAAGDVAIKALEVQVNSSSTSALTFSAPAIRRVGDGSDLTATNAVAGTCNATSNNCQVNIMLDNEEVVAAGTSRTYDIRVAVAGTLTSGDSITSYLVGDTANETGTMTQASSVVSVDDGGGATAYNFVWSDYSAVPHDGVIAGGTSADWTSGQYVKVLPSDTQTLTKS